MTRPTRRAATKTITIWPITGSDPYTGTTYGTPYTEIATFEQGATKSYNDSQGQSFVPASIYWHEITSQGVPKLNSPIALGDHTLIANPVLVDGVEYVRVSKLQDGGRQVNDVMVLT
tara:strand:- start:843 stop:1193 length:351 start_codon:yes stop_codon:yes gene_type:complete